MPTYKDYTTSQYEAWLSAPYNSDWGMSKQDVLDTIKLSAAGKFYNLSAAQLETWYDTVVTAVGTGGAQMFAYTVYTEGGGAGNWVNRWMNDTGDWLKGLRDDLTYTTSLLNNETTGSAPAPWPPSYGTVAFYAPEFGGINPANFQDEPGRALSFLQGLPSGSLGNYWMQATAAGNDWVYSTAFTSNTGIPAYASAADPIGHFGNPYDQILKLIRSNGTNPFDLSTGKKPTPPPAVGTSPTNDNKSASGELASSTMQGLNAQIVYNNDDRNQYSNSSTTVRRIFGNAYQVSWTASALVNLQNNLGGSIDKTLNDLASKNTSGAPKPSITIGNKSNDIMKDIYDLASNDIGGAHDMDGYYGYQCADYPVYISQKLNLGLNFSGNAINQLLEFTDHDGWHKHLSVATDYAGMLAEFNSAPLGSFVFWNSPAPYGHVGVKGADGWMTYAQNQWFDTPMPSLNYSLAHGRPVSYANLKYMTENGGYAGAIWKD